MGPDGKKFGLGSITLKEILGPQPFLLCLCFLATMR
jgi:hypothetical protein